MTFSILARDPANGRFGVAVATCHLAVGSTVPHIRSGVGAVASQAHTNPYLGICGLERLEQDGVADDVLQSLLRDGLGPSAAVGRVIDASRILPWLEICWKANRC